MTEGRVELTRSGTPDGVVLAAAGELDLNSVDLLVDEALEMLGTKPSRLTLDLRQISFCDSTGLAGFMRIRNQAQALFVDLRLRDPSPQVRRLIDITGMTRVFTIEPDSIDDLA